MNTLTDTEMQKKTKRKPKKVWTCDVCRIRKFDDFHEACRHEEQCRKERAATATTTTATNGQGTPSSSPSLSEPVEVNLLDESVEELPQVQAGKKRKSGELNNHEDDDCDDYVIVEMVVEPGKGTRAPESAILSQDSENSKRPPPSSSSKTNSVAVTNKGGNWFTAASKTTKTAAATKQLRKPRVDENNTNKNSESTPRARRVAALNNETSQSTITSKRTFKQAAQQLSRKKNGTAMNNKTQDDDRHHHQVSPEILTVLGGMENSKELLAEHRAAELQAQRHRERLLKQQQQERALPKRASQKKHGQVLHPFFAQTKKKAPTTLAAKNNPSSSGLTSVCTTISSNGDKPKPHKSVVSKTRKTRGIMVPRFPNPSHVIPAVQLSDNAPITVARLHAWLKCNASPENATQICHSYRSHVKMSHLVLPIEESWSSNHIGGLVYPLFSVMSRLIATSKKQDRIPDTNGASGPSQVLADKYRISVQDLEGKGGVGDSLLLAAKQLRAFIEEWKQVRHKSNERMAERQRKLAETKPRRIKRQTATKKKKRKPNDVEDDWLEGKEKEPDQSLRNLMLVTGPVSSGKTSLVHAVTKQCDCQIIEINTSENRCGSKIKQLLEEATQSHSSVELLQKSRLQQMLSEQLVDSEEDDDDEAESDEEKPGADTLAVILIDEVDLLYEEDAGFWSALADLTKSKRRAKCPIILTANTIPDKLRSFKYNHIALDRPSHLESVQRMQHILQGEGFRVDSVADVDHMLEVCATLVDRDLRRFCHEMQSLVDQAVPFSCTPGRLDKIPRIVGQCTENPPKPIFDTNDDSTTTIVLESVKPAFVPALEYSLITLSGRGFLSLASSCSRRSDYVGFDVQVHIGGQRVPDACILDDETVLAVYAPRCDPSLSLQGRNNDKPLFDDDISPNDRDFLPVVLSSVNQNGLLSTTDGAVRLEQFGDGTREISTEKPVVLELRFSDPSERTVEQQSTEVPVVAELMKEGVTAWLSRNEDLAERPPVTVSTTGHDNTHFLADLEDAERRARLASDAATLEFGFNTRLPYLAGPCRGFGVELTDATHMHANEKSEAITESKLFELGWKDNCFYYGTSDAFMRYPSTQRERKQISWAEQTERGRAQAFALGETEEENSYENEDWRPQQLSDQDFLLPGVGAPSLETLPSYLFALSNAEPAWSCLEDEQLAHYTSWIGLLDKVIFFVTLSRDRLFARGLSRYSNNLHVEIAEHFDSRLVLDYIPILRRMAVREMAEDRFVQQSGCAQESKTRSNQPRTRQQKPQWRDHYFGNVAFPYYFARGHRESDMNVQHVTDLLCSRAMGVQMSNPPVDKNLND
ncbi:hypothetical protein ACA910_006001 [Epithemia clementina (nom. ined.)]